ncbi:unnamed protein product [Tilletia controversa]|nr:unnamed protein product [Tilletia laevis]CAD6927739.1 unnamed protein product [Tilletia controversa]CAD6944397.1 unnamed protein product [Tilletia caries]CAD6942711.1 unnamed protein product [Tilletia laevis]CAD6954238.1 unnamed protein product [Tilletia caries]
MSQGSRPLALGLKDYKAALDSGRRISGNNGKNDSRQGTSLNRSGLPLWVVVRMLKASWHAEGSWPLIGADASEKDTQLSLPTNPQRSIGTSVATSTPHPPSSTTTMKIPRSVHPTALLLKGKAPLVTTMTPEPGPPARPDPSPDEVAQAYRARGILVADPPVLIPSDDEGEEAPTGGEAIDDDSA